ncbi:MAG TPA: outer membrane beta-barrel protein [Xanthobacteraceae bacterium]|nr:outer membrane beta-barrel protein [Xanthobacteraceae bacterium]
MTTSIARSLSRWLACAAVTAATAAGLPFVSSASAADMPAQARPVVVAAAPLWTGFYIGIHGGGGWAGTHLSDPSLMVFFETKTINSSGPLAGVQVGANWQFGNVVVGGEIDASWASLKGSVAPGDIVFSGYELHYRALATGTGRVGYAAGAWLSYVKAGIAWADLEQTNFAGTVTPRGVPHTRTGVTAGAGLEWAFWRNLSAKLEYNFIYFGESSIYLGSNRDNGSADHMLHLVKAGLNFRFGGGDAIVARY